MFGNLRSLTYYESNKDDPYITLPSRRAGTTDGAVVGDDEDEDDADEREELQILATDNLLLAARLDDELAHLDVYVYEDAAENLYVHHDIMLPAVPLCVEWLDAPVHSSGAQNGSSGEEGHNFVAVGTFDPDIEIWDLDTVDRMYPNAILGAGGAPAGEQEAKLMSKKAKKSKKKKKKSRSKEAEPNATHHVAAVLALSHNRAHKHLLASASADHTVKLWDLRTATCAASYGHHADKAVACVWHPVESTVLLTGSYDRTVAAIDARAASTTNEGSVRRWAVDADVEGIRWDPHDSNRFYVASERGTLACHDVRVAPASLDATKPVWTLHAHDEPLAAFDVSPHIPGFLATGSADRTVKLWDMSGGGAGGDGPKIVTHGRDLDVGKVFAVSFAPDAEVAFRLAVGGSKSPAPRVWDTSANRDVRRAFGSRMRAEDRERPEGQRMVVIGDDSESEDEEDERTRGGAGLGRGGGDDDGDDEDWMDED